MPTYDYVCDGCQHAFETMQSIKADPLKDCPACKKPKLRRLIGPGAAILFKGSGFYTTDYRSDSYKQRAESDSKSSSTSSDSKSGDSKPSGESKSSDSSSSSSASEKK